MGHILLVYNIIAQHTGNSFKWIVYWFKTKQMKMPTVVKNDRNWNNKTDDKSLETITKLVFFN